MCWKRAVETGRYTVPKTPCMKLFETSFLIKSLKSINITFFNDFDVKLINVAAI